jgi:subtilisin family serine protease
MKGEWWFDTWQIEEKVWPITRGKGVTVVIVDTGVEAKLPELKGVVVPGSDYNGGDGREETERVSSHGTKMAELVAAQGTGSGMLGIAPDAKILPVGTQTIGQIPEGIRYAVDHGAKVVNVSVVGGSASLVM